MASAMASAATRSISYPYAIPVGPRVRPPRLLPGTKAANTNPQPNERPPVKGHVWVQGEWRNPSSNAAKDRREVQSTRVEKALRHVTHGMNIYAYRHIRTNQVVYSLTRVMQNNKILPQLLYYGKKLVPSALRRDLWRPYFSIHFSGDAAGAGVGLTAYRRLRELSALRQLSPPEELVIATEADVEKAKSKYNPLERKLRTKNNTLGEIPIAGQLLPRRLRAKKVMDQKASSVADAAFVLSLINKGESPAQHLETLKDKNAKRFQDWSSRALKRLNKIREEEKQKTTQIEERKQAVQPDEGQLGLTPHAARRIALEYNGSFVAAKKGLESAVQDLDLIGRHQNQHLKRMANQPKAIEGGQNPADFDVQKFQKQYRKKYRKDNGEEPSWEQTQTATRQEADALKTRQDIDTSSRTAYIYWADMRDYTWAENWTDNVLHGILDQRAAIQNAVTLQPKDAIDTDGNPVSEQPQRVLLQGSSTPHVFGNGSGSPWYLPPQIISQDVETRRKEERREWTDRRLEESKRIFLQMYDLTQDTNKHSMLQEMQFNYPSIYDKLQAYEKWRSVPDLYAEFLKLRDQVNNLKSAYDEEDPATSEQLQEIDNQLASHESDFPDHLEKIVDSEKTLLSDITKSRHAIIDFETQLKELKAVPLESRSMQAIDDAQERLDNQHNRIASSRDTTWRARLYAIESVLGDLESDDLHEGTDMMNLITQQVDAEQRDDVDSLASINAELDALREAKIDELIGFASQEPAAVQGIEGGRQAEGIEQPPPKKRGIFARMFGR